MRLRRPIQGSEAQHHKDCQNNNAVALFQLRTILTLHNRIQRQIVSAGQVNSEANQHAYSGGAETIMPSIHLAQRAAYQGCDKGTDIYAENIDGIAGIPSLVRLLVETANLSREISLQEPRSEYQGGQCQEKTCLKRHEEMANRHEQGPGKNGLCPAQKPVSNQPAKNRCKIDEAHISPKYLGCQCLYAQWPEDRLKQAPKGLECRNIPGILRQEKVCRHIQDQQCLHAIEGKPLPRLSEHDIGQPPGVTEEHRIVCAFGIHVRHIRSSGGFW